MVTVINGFSGGEGSAVRFPTSLSDFNHQINDSTSKKQLDPPPQKFFFSKLSQQYSLTEFFLSNVLTLYATFGGYTTHTVLKS